MARPAEMLQEEDYSVVLRRYLRALATTHRPSGGGSPGTQVRTCPTCGDRTIFRLEPEGAWYRCGSCGHYA